MKPTKIRNKLIYRAPQSVLSKQLGCNLSKDLRQKYRKRSVRVIVGDAVKVMRGEYKGVDGKIKKVSTLKNSVAIEGIKKEKLKGGQIDVYIASSNLVVTELSTDDKWRLRKLEGTKQKSTPSVETKEVEKKTEEKMEEPIEEKNTTIKETKQKSEKPKKTAKKTRKTSKTTKKIPAKRSEK